MFNQQLARRIREQLRKHSDVTERKMFGGLSFLIAGHMTCGVVGDDLVLRVGNAAADTALDEPHVRPMDFTGRAIHSMIYVAPAGTATDNELRGWIERGVEYVRTLPPRS
jgi:TfoX/Sxy family transcriptional regulator of competence genes